MTALVVPTDVSLGDLEHPDEESARPSESGPPLRPAQQGRKSRNRSMSRNRNESRNRSVRFRVANAVLLLLVGLTVTAIVGSTLQWWRVETVLSGSMRPGIRPGDLEVLTPEPASSLRVGQVVAFHPPGDTITVTHRVVAIARREGIWITTKGDANRVVDPWGHVRVEGSTVWVVRDVISKLGYVAVLARDNLLRLVAALAAVVGLCVVAMERIWRS